MRAALAALCGLLSSCERSPPQDAPAPSAAPGVSIAAPVSVAAPPSAAPPSAAPGLAEASPYTALTAVCDAKQGVLLLFDPKIQPPDEIPGSSRATALLPGDPAFDCDLGQGHGARLKLGVLPATGGQCGGDPEEFVSIWIDRVKVVSARVHTGRCMYDDTPLAHVRISASGVSWCTAAALAGQVQAQKGLRCGDTPRPKTPIDTDEYGKQRGSAVGQIVIDHADKRARALCEAMIGREGTSSSIAPPANSQRNLVRSVGRQSETYCELSRGRFDFDNDGKPDDVVRRRCGTGSFDADQYFVGNGLPKLPAEFAERDLQPLRTRARLLAPEGWATERVEGRGQLYVVRALQHVAKERDGFPATASSARHKRLRIDYLHLEPFRHAGVTYLLSAPPENRLDLEDTFVLFRPQPKGLPVEACVFHQVQENF